jgi:hypothetical protein
MVKVRIDKLTAVISTCVPTSVFGYKFKGTNMNKNQPLREGIKLRYVGKTFDDFQPDEPLMTFLGYDSGSFCDLWVSYQNKVMCVCAADVEVAVEHNDVHFSDSHSASPLH